MVALFWQWPAEDRGTLAETGWVRAVALTLPEGRGLPEHAAPADALLLCVAGLVRFSLEGEARELHPGDGVVMRAGQRHSVAAGAGGRAVLLLRRDGDRP